MLTMSTLMMPTTMTTMTNPGPIPAHSVPQKIEPPKLTAAATLAHTTTAANKSEQRRLVDYTWRTAWVSRTTWPTALTPTEQNLTPFHEGINLKFGIKRSQTTHPPPLTH
ncbi:hypothetical protein M0804_004102 [Polistes exclamans]|nr:hypothetical protein M0804_004102 [Polistes exclamans]